jgi:MFS family permease
MTEPGERPGICGLLRARPRYRRLCAAVAISETGDWLLFIALPLFVLQRSGSALATSTVFLAELIPAVLVGTLCGPFIDRARPARLLATITSVQAALLLPLLWAGPGTLWLVYLVAAVQAAATSLTVPAQQALVPSLVGADELASANALLETASNGARLIGSPLGGVLLPAVGLQVLVVGDMVSFLISAALLVRCGRAARATVALPAADAARPRAIAAGWRAIRRAPTLRSAVVISFLSAVAQGLFLVLFVLFVLRALHAGDQVVGLLRGVQAIGGVIGGLVVGVWAARLGARALAVAGLASFGLVSLVTWNSPGLTTATWWYVTLFIAVGVPATALATGLITGTQAVSPPGVRGRVLSLLQVAQALGQGTGIVAAGLLADQVPLGVLLNVQASCYLACALVALVGFARPHPVRVRSRPPGLHRVGCATAESRERHRARARCED